MYTWHEREDEKLMLALFTLQPIGPPCVRVLYVIHGVCLYGMCVCVCDAHFAIAQPFCMHTNGAHSCTQTLTRSCSVIYVLYAYARAFRDETKKLRAHCCSWPSFVFVQCSGCIFHARAYTRGANERATCNPCTVFASTSAIAYIASTCTQTESTLVGSASSLATTRSANRMHTALIMSFVRP